MENQEIQRIPTYLDLLLIVYLLFHFVYLDLRLTVYLLFRFVYLDLRVKLEQLSKQITRVK
jgi:hypothetical protein